MKVLFEATVNEFYRQKAGFFAALLLIGFGVLTEREHYGLALFFLTGSPAGFWIAVGLYAVMAGIFWNSLWKSPPYAFVYQARLLALPSRIFLLTCLSLGLLLPVIAYSIWITYVAWKENFAHSLGMIWTAPLSMILILMAGADWRLKHPATYYAQKKTRPIFSFARPATPVFWTLEWLVRERGLTLLLCKLGAAIGTAATLLYYGTDTYDLRLPAIGLSVSTLAHIGLSYEIFQWDQKQWQWGQTLPLSLARRAFDLAAIHFLLLVPDFLIIVRYGRHLLRVGDLLQLILLQLCILLAYHSDLYRTRLPLEKTLGRVFVGVVTLTLMVLYKIQLPILACILLLPAYHSYRKFSR